MGQQQTLEQSSSLKKNKTTAILGLLGGVAAMGVIGAGCASQDNATPSTPTTGSGSTTTRPTTTYKDGTYEADGTYQSPAGQEGVHISVTLKDGIVTDTTFQGGAQAPRSQQFQGIFAQNYKSLVVGKKIDQIQLSEVSGSSLTPNGFNDALAKIEAQAKL